MEKRTCKKCGVNYYYDSEYCYGCLRKMELDEISSLTDDEIQNEYLKIAHKIIETGELDKELRKRLITLMMACEKVNPQLQVVCAKFKIYEVPEVFIGAEKVVVDKLNEMWLEDGKKDYKLRTALEMATGEEESIARCSKECYELILDDFEIDDYDISKIKLNIVTPDGETISIKDFWGPFIDEDCLPYEMMGKKRKDNGKEATYRVGKRISAFLPRLSEFEEVNAYGGYAAWDFDDFESCEKCDGELEHIAQISGVPFHFDDGNFFISKCKDCGKYVVQYFQT